ncbi:DNA-3-methyladenine glycosylase I [Mariniphaga sp.]|uniref:DNA-3-methyladenine glycosylase I n=1 Tax=Mariniphaga sp. TaxID=1954475 RepID=UPI003568B583
MCERCNWSTSSERMIKYHDTEWGVPLHDDEKLFEFLVLEGFQAGLSWQIVLHKREDFRRAFDGFVPETISAYDEKKLEKLLQDKTIIRNKQKISACVNNALQFIKIQKEFESFNNYIWSFVNYKPIVNSFSELNQLPAKTLLSDQISDDLKKRGFKFVGSTVVYAHMQATGMVNDHLTNCFRYQEIISCY